jgi:hypothetical protein
VAERGSQSHRGGADVLPPVRPGTEAEPHHRHAAQQQHGARRLQSRSGIERLAVSGLSAGSVSQLPIRDDDSLATRGATWSFLRYAADRQLRAGGQDATVFQALVNSTTTGVANLRGVFGADVGGWLRDWSVSHYTDDVTPSGAADLSQPSWNWHDIYPSLGSGGGTYPLPTLALTTTGATGTVIPGASAYYRFAVPANGSATVTVSGGSSSAGLPMGTIVRIR